MIERAFDETGAVVGGVKPEQLGAPTPCAEWDVRALLNHLLLVAGALARAGRQQPVPDEHWAADVVSDDWAGAFDEHARAATAAWAEPAPWAGPARLGGSPMPAEMAVAMLTADLAVHGWDLARATGQDYRCDDEVAAATYDFLRGMAEQGRAMGIFAAEVTVRDDEPVFVRALALSGRDPR